MSIEQVLQSGVAHHQAGRLRDAELCYRRVLEQIPTHPDALFFMGVLVAQVGRYDSAADFFRRAIQSRPAELYYRHLGKALSVIGRYDEALAACHEAMRLQPDSASRPDYADVYHDLANIAVVHQSNLDAALAYLQTAIALRPNDPAIYSTLGNTLTIAGRIGETFPAYRKALELNPRFAAAHSNLIFAMQYHPDVDAAALLDEARQWDQRHAKPTFQTDHVRDRSPLRRLRVGYVSADFRNHIAGRTMLPVLREHDRSAIESFCYSSGRPDGFTMKLRGVADHWHQTHDISDSDLADLIRRDQIDVLVDLSLHSSGNRLPMMSTKPAPVQMTFGGYPGTTGVHAIDYRLSDPYLDPPGDNDSDYSEITLRLADTFWCYDAEAMEFEKIPQPNDLPAMQNGYVTFGCLNSFNKINDTVVPMWAATMAAVPKSRLIVLAVRGSPREQLAQRLEAAGISRERLEFTEFQPREAYLRNYHRIDLSLDTVPYNGHTTSMDSFWMGVPVVTCIGRTVVGRAGFSQLGNLGLPELAGRNADEFVRIASSLAMDLPRLQELRRTLRARMLASPLGDVKKFTRSIESAYRTAWRKWCEER